MKVRKQTTIENYSVQLAKATQNRIIELCRQHDMSQKRLSVRAGVNQSTLSEIMRGNVNAQIYTISRIATAFDLTLKDFFDSHYFNEVNKLNINIPNRLKLEVEN